MPVLVHKYGGTSVGTVERIRAVADRVLAAQRTGHHMVVVVSAMGQYTDDLLELARQITTEPNQRELDMLLTAGERISMALLALALQDRGARAISFTGSQTGILTDERHGRARVTEIRPHRVREALNKGAIVIVAGFQGVSREREVTTLGRGGSDTTAVALAASFGAACVIHTDVDGVFSADPRLVPEARRLARIGYDVMSLLAHAGAQVLHARCVDLAAKYKVPLEVKSSFHEGEGTMITDPAALEGPAVRAIALERHAVLAVLEGTDCAPGAEGSVLEALSALDVPVDALALDSGRGRVRLAWTLSEADASAFEAAWAATAPPAGRWQLTLERGRSLVTLAGHDLAGDADVALAASRVLSRSEIPVLGARVTPLSVSFLVPSERADDAMRRLHTEMIEKAGSGTPAR
ncbi:MAG TPA: aspartate kinase [Candidatus Eisenbacteria bacterium]|nr:aspartate kinase [Candidatus Eisenbacteria bacterium]